MKQIIRPLAAFLLLNLVVSGALLVGPLVGLAVGGVLFFWFLYGYLLRPGRPGEARRRTTLRLRPLGSRGRRAVLASLPVFFGLTWSAGQVWTRLVPVPPETFRPFETLTGTPLGRLSVILLAVVAAPLLEEMVFRGMVQRHLERRWGPARAIAATAAVFALVHFLPWIYPLHFVLGLVFGYAVWATRSIWAGVVLHAANNALAVLGIAAEEPTIPPTIWKTGFTAGFWTALLVLALSSVAAVWAARWLWRAGHAARVREVTWRGRERRWGR